jgi:hypothetical protein
MSLTLQELEALKKGIDEFNRREFFQCHETLEALWQVRRDPDRELLQGIIQIAVAYYHVKRDNPEGALRLFRRGLARVEKFSPSHFELDLADFIANVSEDIRCVEGNQQRQPDTLKMPSIGFISLYTGGPDC